MFTDQEIQMLQDALDMSIISTKRAQNSKPNPAFQPIYKQLIEDLNGLKLKISNIQKQPPLTNTRKPM